MLYALGIEKLKKCLSLLFWGVRSHFSLRMWTSKVIVGRVFVVLPYHLIDL